ncbi:MAG TPA: glycosyltransferase family 4 protein, partial [Chitinophagaceae bacterium]|nr:glycosyltransferase family 4 protein [Chitinophagaceae bacterium]
PILFEGLHTTFWLNHLSLKNRIKLLRAHNIESDYYYQLGNHASSYLKKLYFYLESNRLKWYENYLSGMQHLLSISEADTRYFSTCYPNIPTSYIPAFHANEEVNIIPGQGKYCLYHGNLSVAENIKSVRYLVKEVFNDLNIPLIIAGKNPPADLINHVADHITIIANPSEQEMETLISEAHIHVLPSFQNTGMNLKLLHALFAGRFCIMNQSILDENISTAIIFAKDASAFKQHIRQTMPLPFTEEAIESRKKVLKPYMNVVNGQKIIDIIQQTVKQTV